MTRRGGSWSDGPSLPELDAYGTTREEREFQRAMEAANDRPSYGLEAGTIECPMCGIERDRRCRSCGGCDCECVCGED